MGATEMPLQSSLLALGRAVALALPILLTTESGAQQIAADVEVVAVVDSFHRALQRGDSSAVLALLAADVVILESGGAETRDEYRSHHLRADGEFLRAVRTKRGPIRVAREGSAAWASSVSEIAGSFKGRRVDSEGAELLVLSQDAGGWRIRATHWSSHPKGGS
jgi:ketosteroid isomerase-like protein